MWILKGGREGQNRIKGLLSSPRLLRQRNTLRVLSTQPTTNFPYYNGLLHHHHRRIHLRFGDERPRHLRDWRIKQHLLRRCTEPRV